MRRIAWGVWLALALVMPAGCGQEAATPAPAAAAAAEPAAAGPAAAGPEVTVHLSPT